MLAALVGIAISCALLRLRTDGHLYLRTEGKGTVVLIEATPQGFKEKGRFEQPDRSEIAAAKGPSEVSPYSDPSLPSPAEIRGRR